MFQLKVRSCGICTYFLLAELTSNLEGKETWEIYFPGFMLEGPQCLDLKDHDNLVN